jgi:hypothetical protein
MLQPSEAQKWTGLSQEHVIERLRQDGFNELRQSTSLLLLFAIAQSALSCAPVNAPNPHRAVSSSRR